MGIFPSRQVPKNQLSLTVDDLCKIARTGDLILLSGNTWNSWLVESLCSSQWSHCVIVIENLNCLGEPYIFESVRYEDRFVDVLNHSCCNGTRLVHLREYLDTYSGNAVAIRHLQSPAHTQVTFGKYIETIMFDCIKEFHGRPYEKRWSDYIFARYRDWWGKETPDALFCSELIAACYMRCGLLPNTHEYPRANQYLPDDFSAVGELVLQKPPHIHYDVKFSEEKYVLLPRINPDIWDLFHWKKHYK